MRYRLALGLLLWGVTAGSAAEPPLTMGTRLPPLRGADLAGHDVQLPDAAHGRVAVLLFGFSYGSRTAVEDWARHLQAAWPDTTRVTWYQLPMIGGLGRLAKPFITGGMRKETPAQYHGNSVVVFGGTGTWKARLAVSDERAAYVLLLDQQGIVRWRLSAASSAEHAAELDRQVTGLLEGLPPGP